MSDSRADDNFGGVADVWGRAAPKAARYADISDALTSVGLSAEFVRSDGIGAAVTVSLHVGCCLFVPDRGDQLSRWTEPTFTDAG